MVLKDLFQQRFGYVSKRLPLSLEKDSSGGAQMVWFAVVLVSVASSSGKYSICLSTWEVSLDCDSISYTVKWSLSRCDG
jgi:hypothetical protein